MGTRKSAAGLLAVAATAGITAAVASAYTGTPQGKQLAGEMLASYKHVHAIAGTLSGDVWYCPSTPEGVYIGARSTSCATPATESTVALLSHGLGSVEVGTVKAHGQPTISFVTSHAGTYSKAAGGTCWKQSTPDRSIIGQAPFSYFPKEYMSVSGSGGGKIMLTGTVAGVLTEVDTISASTHEIVGENIHYLGAQGFTLHTRYRNASAPATPKTTPLC